VYVCVLVTTWEFKSKVIGHCTITCSPASESPLSGKGSNKPAIAMKSRLASGSFHVNKKDVDLLRKVGDAGLTACPAWR